MKFTWFLCACVLVSVFTTVTPRTGTVIASTEATCSALETTVTCTGTGNLTQKDVRNAGAYTKFTTAIVEEGITGILGSAFLGCYALVDVSLPNKLQILANSVFDGCKIVSLNLPKTLISITPSVVNNCPTFQNFMVGGSVTGSLTKNYSVKDGFLLSKDGSILYASPTGKCAGETLNLPSGITEMRDACRWSRAQAIVVPISLTNIKTNAFYRSYMTSLTLNTGVTDFAEGALSGCYYLERININGNKKFFMSNGVFGKGTYSSPTSIIKVFSGVTKMESVSQSVSIGSGALQLCETLTNITFATATKKKEKLRSLLGNKLVAKNVTSTDKKEWEWQISACVGGATSIDMSTLTSYKWIGTGAFRGCSLLKTLILHSDIKKLGESLARDCGNLTHIDFKGCYCGNSTVVGTEDYGMNVIPPYCCNGSPVEYIGWPGSKNLIIGREAFKKLPVDVLELPSNSVNIEVDVFSNSKMTKIVVNNNLQVIGSGAFRGCTLLETISFASMTSSKLVTIESMAFTECTSLKTVKLPDSLTTIIPSCFAYCSNLTSILFHANTGKYKSDGLACYESENGKQYYRLAICPAGLEVFDFEQETYEIGDGAFYGCSNLVSVRMMQPYLQTIQQSAFFECHRIEFVQIPPNIKTIGKSAFASCDRLKNILYCSNRAEISYTWDPFPTNPRIMLWYDYPGTTFCGHPCNAILDHECNIPTQIFSDLRLYKHRRSIYELFIGVSLPQFAVL